MHQLLCNTFADKELISMLVCCLQLSLLVKEQVYFTICYDRYVHPLLQTWISDESMKYVGIHPPFPPLQMKEIFKSLKVWNCKIKLFNKNCLGACQRDRLTLRSSLGWHIWSSEKKDLFLVKIPLILFRIIIKIPTLDSIILYVLHSVNMSRRWVYGKNPC